jgi:hypothetical protein
VAIHGAILTAWSAAAIAGPVIITQLSTKAGAGIVSAGSKNYDTPLHVLAVLLVVGFLLSVMVRPLAVRPSI